MQATLLGQTFCSSDCRSPIGLICMTGAWLMVGASAKKNTAFPLEVARTNKNITENTSGHCYHLLSLAVVLLVPQELAHSIQSHRTYWAHHFENIRLNLGRSSLSLQRRKPHGRTHSHKKSDALINEPNAPK